MRVCSNCNLNKSYVRKDGYENWYRHKDGYFCQKCYHRLITNPINNKKHRPRQLVWTPNDKRLLLKESPRKGICQKCGKKIGDEYVNYRGKPAIIKQTQIHHFEYHEDDPLKDTIELCGHCHGQESITKRSGAFTRSDKTVV
jgi:hypothetical protein